MKYGIVSWLKMFPPPLSLKKYLPHFLLVLLWFYFFINDDNDDDDSIATLK